MNKELCKKCFKQESVFFRVHDFACSMLNQDDGVWVLVHFDLSQHLFCNRRCLIREENANKIFLDRRYFSQKKFDFVEMIDNKCPYYLEHHLYDWNHKQ